MAVIGFVIGVNDNFVNFSIPSEICTLREDLPKVGLDTYL